MEKMCIFSKIKVIFLSIIGIFAVSSAKVYGNYEFFIRNGFLNQMYDDKEKKIFKDLYKYMNTTKNNARKSYIEKSILKEIENALSERSASSIHTISKRVFKFAFGEVLSRVIPVFQFSDKDALTLASIFLDVDPKEILEVAEESGAEFMGCREFGYSYEDKYIRKCCGDRRFYFIFNDEYEYEDFENDENMWVE